jgi:hypothetical protein
MYGEMVGSGADPKHAEEDMRNSHAATIHLMHTLSE